MLSSCGTGQRLFEDSGAALERHQLLVRHLRIQNLDRAVLSDHAGKRKSDAEFPVEAPDRDDCPLVADDDLRDPPLGLGWLGALMW